MTLAVSYCALVACSGGADTPPGNDDGYPLAEYLGTSPFAPRHGGVEFTLDLGEWIPSDQERRDHQRLQESIAACMRDEGFDYVPERLDAPHSPASDEAYSLDLAEFTQQYGYGISTVMFTADAQDNREAGPNEVIRDALSTTARAAYDRALWGEPRTPSDDGGADPDTSDAPDPAETGCSGRAHDEIVHDETDLGVGQFTTLFGDISTLQERIDRDPRVVAAIDEWRHCMADGGYPGFGHPDATRESIIDQVHEAADSGDGEAEPGSGVVITGDTRQIIDPEQFSRIRQHEIDLATVDLICRDEHYRQARREVVIDLEREFVDDNLDQLERYREWSASHAGDG